MNTTEAPQKLFQGAWLSLALFDLFERRVLNANEILLLLYIKSYEHPVKKCFASNKHLGKWWGKTPSWVSAAVSKFQKLGLVEVEYFNEGQRTHRKITTLFDVTHPHQEKSGGSRKVEGGVLENHKRILVTLVSKNKLSATASGELTDGMFGDSGEYSQFIQKAAHKLEDHLRLIHKLDLRIKRKHWYHQMELLLQSLKGDKARLKKVLTAYMTSNAKFKPQAYSAETFRKKFVQIEAWSRQFAPPARELTRIVDDVLQVWSEEDLKWVPK